MVQVSAKKRFYGHLYVVPLPVHHFGSGFRHERDGPTAYATSSRRRCAGRAIPGQIWRAILRSGDLSPREFDRREVYSRANRITRRLRRRITPKGPSFVFIAHFCSHRRARYPLHGKISTSPRKVTQSRSFAKCTTLHRCSTTWRGNLTRQRRLALLISRQPRLV